MDVLVKKIAEESPEEFSMTIDSFHRDYGSQTTFAELNNSDLREKFWGILFNYLLDNKHSELHQKCLSALRILSRDKTNLESIITNDRLNTILELAYLAKQNEDVSYTDVTIEALKLLCNLIFNCENVQQILPDTPCLRCLTERMKNYPQNTARQVKFFDSRIIFLITAVNVSTRRSLKTELGAVSVLTKILSEISTRCETENSRTIEAEDVDLACEVLKALFNLYINPDDVENEAEEKSRNLVFILYKLLTLNCNEKVDELHRNIVNLLIVLPFESYKSIIPVPSKNTKVIFQNVDMTAISILLEFLDRKLNTNENTIENLTPTVSAFIRLVKAEKSIRRYVRLQILPPLKDVMKRPEEGTTLRAKLCKLLTSPLTELRDLVAEFLFILCKENVSRMIKYTGYGNAAGMFANKGLLAPNRTKGNYSSESEESDTEEYQKHKEQINPVTGCYEQPKPSPLEGMTEEQKEYEALQLVGLVDKLSRGGMVQPCRIGEDGRPKPIEHVLELQEELPKQQLTNRDSDSD